MEVKKMKWRLLVKKLNFSAFMRILVCISAICTKCADSSYAGNTAGKPSWKLASNDIAIVKNGKPNAVIVVADSPIRLSYTSQNKTQRPWKTVYYDANYAARELAKFIKQSTGADLKIVKATKAPETGNLILVGKSYISEEYGINYPEPVEGFVISTFKRGVAIIGNIVPAETNPVKMALDSGTLHGIYAFLENVAGCRFYFYKLDNPELGFIIPKAETITVPADYAIQEAPDFQHRLGSAVILKGGDAKWFPVIRHGSSTGFKANHTDEQWGLNFRKEHPEYFAIMKDGTRHHEKLCYSSTAMLDRRIKIIEGFYQDGSWRGGWHKPNDKYIPFVPSDHQLWDPCQCESCMDLYDRSRGRYGKKSDVIFSHGKQLAEGVQTRWPNKRVAMLAYAAYMVEPTFELPNNLDVMVCMWMSPLIGKEDYIHKFNMDLLRRWSKKLDNRRNRLFVWDYPCWPGNLSSALFICPNYLQKWFRETYSISSGEFLNSAMKNLQTGHLMNYVWFRLMWDRNLDMEILINEYCELFYGPAKKPMLELHLLAIKRYENVKWSENLPHWYPPGEFLYGETYTKEIIAQIEFCLTQADTLCSNDKQNIYRQRLEWMKAGLKPFIDEATLAHKWLDNPSQYSITNLEVPPKRLEDWKNIIPTQLVSGKYGEKADVETNIKMVHSGKDIHILFDAEESTTLKDNDQLVIEFYPQDNFQRKSIFRVHDHFELEYFTAPDLKKDFLTVVKSGISDGTLDAGMVLNEHKNGRWVIWMRFPKSKLEQDKKLPHEIAVQIKRVRAARTKKDLTEERQHHGHAVMNKKKTYTWQPQLKYDWSEFNILLGRVRFEK